MKKFFTKEGISNNTLAKIRYISDGKIFFVKVVVILCDGRTLTAIADTAVSDIDANWYIFLSKAKAKWRSKIDSFQVVQLSRHDPEVKQYIKANNIHLPSQSPEENAPPHQDLKLSDEAKKLIHKLPVKNKMQPGKYRSPAPGSIKVERG